MENVPPRAKFYARRVLQNTDFAGFATSIKAQRLRGRVTVRLSMSENGLAWGRVR